MNKNVNVYSDTCPAAAVFTFSIPDADNTILISFSVADTVELILQNL